MPIKPIFHQTVTMCLSSCHLSRTIMVRLFSRPSPWWVTCYFNLIVKSYFPSPIIFLVFFLHSLSPWFNLRWILFIYIYILVYLGLATYVFSKHCLLIYMYEHARLGGPLDKLIDNCFGEFCCILSGQIGPILSQYQLIQLDLSKSFSCLTFERLARWPLHQSHRQMVQFVSAKLLPSLDLYWCCLLSSHQPDG